MNKPVRLEKRDPITVQLTPAIILAGVLLLVIMLNLSLGLTDNYNYLLGGI